jgi:predicted LPLAT superfamily acyltransferase
MALSKASQTDSPRNPGPGWGYLFMYRVDAALPAPVFNFLLGLGTWVAVACMPKQRRHSRDYLTTILQRPATLAEIWRHFLTFARALMLKLRVAEGQPHQWVNGPDCIPFERLMASNGSTLLGTFHLGDSDLLGFMLGQRKHRIYMIRLRVENSRDTQRLARRFGESVVYLWVNEPENLLFSLKEAVQSGASVAMKCDRPEYSAKLEPFEFLGQRRLFPFTIYHLALIFSRPVVLCVSIPHGRNESLVYSSTIFAPNGNSKAENLARARVHFQGFLARIESLLRQNPFLWFNFTPLNPAAPPNQ